MPHHRLRSATARRDADTPDPDPGSRRASRHRATFSYSQRHTGHRERARGAQTVPGMTQGWSQPTPGTPSYRQRHAPKPAIHTYGMLAAMSGAWGPDPIPASDSRTGPSGRPPPRIPANRAQPGKTEHHGSLMMTGRSCSRAHTDSSVPLGPNPISRSDPRIGPRKQVVRQRSQTTPIQKRRNPAVPPDQDQPATRPATAPKPNQTQSRQTNPKSVH